LNTSKYVDIYKLYDSERTAKGLETMFLKGFDSEAGTEYEMEFEENFEVLGIEIPNLIKKQSFLRISEIFDFRDIKIKKF